MIVLAVASPAAAHLTPNSEVVVTADGKTVTLDVIVPRGEYAYATGHPVDGSHLSLATARAYLQDHFAIRSPTGEAWEVAFQSIEFVQLQGPPDLHAIATLTPPVGAATNRFSIEWTVLFDELPGHFALFLLADPTTPETRTILGALRQDSEPLAIVIERPGMLQQFTSAASLGAHHILEGYDHLLFLLAMLLPAPLIALGGRWTGRRAIGETAVLLAKIVTAFTIGHSLILIGATLGGWKLPVQPVEVAIALSVLASAVHALRPIMPGKEPLVALLFGLIHGLAFATLVQEAGASMSSSATSLLGFNLGIEVVQLAIVAAVMPTIIMLARHQVYATIRPVLATAFALAALAWILNRTTGHAAALVGWIETALQVAALPAIIGLLVVAVAMVLVQRWGLYQARLWAGGTQSH
ncbi:MAG: HupE/UreJ family protein [Pseudomonadota bacterium]